MTIEEVLIKVNYLKQELENLMPFKAEDEDRLWAKTCLDWNYNSNHLEGNTLTYNETQLFLILGKMTGDHDKREYDEMEAHDVALHVVSDMVKDIERPLTENFIKELNKTILVKPYWKEAITTQEQPTQKLIKVGGYKDTPNSVRLPSGEFFKYASPEEVRPMMEELINFYRIHDVSTETHPLWLAAMFHYKFVRIHPFDDGNGRIARLIMNYILMRKGYPPVIILSADKRNYLFALSKADTGDLESFVVYIGEQLILAIERSIKTAKGESIEEMNDIDKEITLWKRQLKGSQADVLTKSDVQVGNIYKNGITQLFKLFIEKHKQFGDLFAETIVLGYVNGGNADNKGIEHIEESIHKSDLKRGQFLKMGQSALITNQFNQFRIEVQLKGFKKNHTNAFDHYSTLSIEFQPYIYKILVNGEQLEEKLYSEFIDPLKAEEIINRAMKKAFEEIKNRMKKK